MQRSDKLTISRIFTVIILVLAALRGVVHFREEVSGVSSFFGWLADSVLDPLALCGYAMVLLMALICRDELADYFRHKSSLLRQLAALASVGDELFTRPNVDEDIRSYTTWKCEIVAWKDAVLQVLDHYSLAGEAALFETDLPDDDEFKKYHEDAIVSRWKNILKARIDTIHDIIRRHSSGK